MRTWLMLLGILASQSMAGTVMLEMDPDQETEVGFTIEAKAGGELDPGEWKPLLSTHQTSVTISGITPGLWSFRARSVHLRTELVSVPSNVVMTTIVPDSPKLKVAFQSSKDMQNWVTEFTADIPKSDRQFFRIAFIP